MRLLFVGTHCVDGGGERHFVTLARAMAQTGHDVGAVVCPDSPIAAGLAGSTVRIYHGRFRNALDWRAWRTVKHAVSEFKPDWMVGSFGKEYWPLILLSRRMGVPLALFRHRAPALKGVSRYLVPRLAQRFIAISQFLRDALIAQGVPHARVSVLYNPFEIDRYPIDNNARIATRQALGIPEDAVVLGFAGRMFTGKGIFHLLESANAAMAVNHRLRCLWIGDGPDREALRAAVAASPFAARHHWVTWADDMYRYYNAMDMLAAPSIQAETFGRTLVEAQACGVPVLGANVGGIAEAFAPDQTGVLLRAGDVDAWRDAIVHWCDPAPRLLMAHAARDYVLPRFNAPVIAAQFEQLLLARAPQSSNVVCLQRERAGTSGDLTTHDDTPRKAS